MRGEIMSELRAFTVTTDHFEVSLLVFAKNASHARALARSGEWFADVDWIELKARREPKADQYSAKFGEGFIRCSTEAEQRLVRSLGWYEINSSHSECAVCGLSPWSLVPESELSDYEDGLEYICLGCSKKQDTATQR